jgi:hypothetical protein
VAARQGSWLYLSSEEAGIRAMCPDPDLVWTPRAGYPVIGRLGSDVVIGQPESDGTAAAVQAVGREVPSE